jgi:hypothetical protein
MGSPPQASNAARFGKRPLELQRPIRPRLLDDLEAVFLDNRIGQDFLGDALQLLLRFFTVPAVQIQDEKFALADVFDGLITQAGERVVDSLALGIEDRAFRHDPDVSFHVVSITFGA